MGKYDGLIPNRQRIVSKSPDRWQFGYIINGKKQIDPVLGLGCYTLGFDRTDIIQHVAVNLENNIYENAEDLFGSDDSEIYLHDIAFELQDKLYEKTGYHSFYALSGSDANEGAIKLSAAAHKLRGNNNKKGVISFYGSYHGSTYLNYSMGDENLFSDPFYNLMKPDWIRKIRFEDLTKVPWDKIMCIVIESRQWATGLIEPPESFWNQLEIIRKTFDVDIIIDDIFMGGGKTGSWCGWKSLPIKPDIFTQGKGITGGYFPLSATLYSQRIADLLPNDFLWEHGFTYSFSSSGILSCLKFMELYEQCDFETVNAKAIEVLGNAQIRNFGNVFYVNDGALVVPLNATEEYFDLLGDKYGR